MNLDLPQHLHSTRDLLIASMKTPSTDQAPALPRALLEDLTRSVGMQPTRVNHGQSAGFVAMFRSMFASPVFGGAAAAVVVLAIASSVVLNSGNPSGSETFRGSSSYTAAGTARVILVAAPIGMQHDLEDASVFEDGIFTTAATTESASSIPGSRVVVDFSAKTITAFNASGDTVYESDLPESTSGISLKIASALTRR